MIHAKFQYNRNVSEEGDFLKVYTINGHDNQLGHLTWTTYTNFHFFFRWMPHTTFCFEWLKKFWRRCCLKTVDGQSQMTPNLSAHLELNDKTIK